MKFGRLLSSIVSKLIQGSSHLATNDFVLKWMDCWLVFDSAAHETPFLLTLECPSQLESFDDLADRATNRS